MSKFESMGYTSKFSLDSLDGNSDFKNDKGNHECVVLVQQATGIPSTSTWSKGIKVMDAKAGEISVGTVIATFDENGKYPNDARHAAIYESHDQSGINVIDQWNKQGKAARRKIRLKKGKTRDVNDADWYYVVETK